VKSGDLIAGRYLLRERLGQGGMSVVWRADDDVLGREVAVKVLSSALAGDPGLRSQIRAEARTAARLRHTNVVAVFDYGELTEGGQTLSYVVMELVDGRTLADMLTGGRLPWAVTVLVGAQVAAALAAAHAQGIVHRDVKPANVMVTSGGVKLVDFGISAAVGALDDQNGQILGTPAYLAPERIEGGPVRPATDVYALGLLLYLALAGRMPWQASTVTQMVKAHVYARPAPLPFVAGLPPAVAQLVSRCLAKRAADRPSSIEVAEVLGEIAGLPSSALMRTATAPTEALAAPVTGRPRTRGLLAAAGVAAGLLAFGGFWLAGDHEPAQALTTCTSECVSSAPPSPSATRPARTTQPVVVTSPPAVVARHTVLATHRRGSPRAATRVKPAPAHPKPKPPKAPKPPKKPGR
jgi:eukaryotic-like serine/threonine-protein kinase